MEERRKSTRIETQLAARWETPTGFHEGTVVNCSSGGCFVQAQVEEPGAEPVKLRVQLPNGKHMNLWGQVVYYLPTMGFGLRFTNPSTANQLMIEIWVGKLQAHLSATAPLTLTA
jgi:PilZ domain